MTKTAIINEDNLTLDLDDSLFTTKKKKHKNSTFTFIDLFAGIGGTRLGFESAGGECVFTSEWDVHAQRTYEANFGDKPHGDITKIKSSDIPDFDVLLAGFPCQPFSSIGRRQGFLHETQGTLFHDVARIIKDKQPKAFMLENVPGLLTHDRGNTFTIIKNTLKELGYTVDYKVLNSAEFGVPQQRKRIYIVGFRKDLVGDNFQFEYPEGKKKNVFISKFLEKNAEGYSISKRLQDGYMCKKDDGRPMIVDHDSHVHVKTLVASYHKIQRLTGTFVRDGETGLRLFTHNECKAIMGFPMDYKIPVSRTQMYRQFGNSIVVPVVSAVAKKMAPLLASNQSSI